MTADDEQTGAGGPPREEPPSNQPRRPDTRGGGAVSGAEFAGLGLQFVVALLLFLFVGRWLDRRLGTYPWLQIVGMFVGAGSAFYGMYRKLMAAQARSRRSGAPPRDGSSGE
jgi:F0F1-type ATP synthase assembly protein I